MTKNYRKYLKNDKKGDKLYDDLITKWKLIRLDK